MKRRCASHLLFLRVAGGTFASLVFFLESGCASSPSSPFIEKSSLSSSSIPTSLLAAYEGARARAWDPSRRFKALFSAEVSPKIGAIGRGYFSVWWSGATGTLAWRASAPLGGAGKGGFLRKGMGDGGATDQTTPDPSSALLPGRYSSNDLLALMLGSPDVSALPSSPFEETSRGWRLHIDDSKRSASVLLDREGRPIEFSFPNGEIVKLQPGEGVPRRIEANGPGGRAVLSLESYSSWPESEEVPPL